MTLLDLMDAPAHETLTDKMARYFRAHEGQWLDLADLAAVGGIGGFRTRISECRHAPYGMAIDNRLLKWEDGRNRSQYRLRPAGSRQEQVA